MRERNFDEARLRAMHAQGLSKSEIASAFGVARQTVRKWLIAIGMTGHERGHQYPDEEIQAVLALWSDGMSMAAIARKTGLPWARVKSIINTHFVPQVAEKVEQPGLTGRLIATKGRWAALSEIAAQQGWSQAKAQQEFHRARAMA